MSDSRSQPRSSLRYANQPTMLKLIREEEYRKRNPQNVVPSVVPRWLILT